MIKQQQNFVQRQSMERQTFEIFHYRDPRIREVPIHHHDFYEVYLFLGGKVEYRVEARTYTLERGDLLLINPMEFHQPLVEPTTPYERIVLWINRGYLENLANGSDSLCECFHAGTNLFRPSATLSKSGIAVLMESLVNEYYSKEYGNQYYTEGIFLQLMTELNRLAMQKSADVSKEEEHPLVSQVLLYIDEHCRENISLEGIAERFYISKYHLAHSFRQAVGTGIYRYVLLKRLLIAKRSLAEGISPGEVAHGCGFRDYSNFYRAFIAEYGLSPKEYAQSAHGIDKGIQI